MRFVNVFRQVENMEREDQYPWRWSVLVIALDLVWCLLTGLLFEAYAPILMVGFHFCLIWISGLVGFYRNRWFFSEDYERPCFRKQGLVSILCLCPIMPMIVLASRGILDGLCKTLIGMFFCLVSYGFAASLGERNRDNPYGAA
ncbi:MAG: hypothetical protein HFI93_11630 [Lachnospiraceae bacterium]|nr:hypothetical protein [Lachnospiraceae bacterium]